MSPELIRDDSAFPRCIATLERPVHGMGFQQDAQLGQFVQIVFGDRRGKEAALPFGDHEPLHRQTVERFAQGRCAGAVSVAQCRKLQLVAGPVAAKNDVTAQCPVKGRADRGGLGDLLHDVPCRCLCPGRARPPLARAGAEPRRAERSSLSEGPRISDIQSLSTDSCI